MGVKGTRRRCPTSAGDPALATMPHVTPTDEGAGPGDRVAPGELLAAALDERGLSVRAFAKDIAGPDATHEQVESVRRQLRKWLDPNRPTIPNNESAELLAGKLGLPADYFKTPRPARRPRTDEMELMRAELAELREQVVELQRLAALGRGTRRPRRSAGGSQ